MAHDHSNDLVTLEMAKAHIGSSAEDDDKISDLIMAASQAANKHCGRLLKARDLVEIYDGDDTAELFVDQYPINSIASIYQDSTRVFGAAYLVPAGYYMIDKDLRRIWGTNVYWHGGLQTIQLSYNAGLDPVDHDLSLAVLIMVEVWYKAFADHRFGVSSTTSGENSITYEKSMPKQAKDLLNPYINELGQ